MWPEGFPLELAGARLSEVDVPVLVVNGENDLPYVETAAVFTDAIPRSETLILPDADHFGAVFAAEFQEAALVFLSDR